MNIQSVSIISKLAGALLSIISCQSETPTDPPVSGSDLSQLRGVYLGQPPPGNVPVRFAPDNSFRSNGAWWWQSAPVFSPDGNEMYFTKYFTGSEVHAIWYTKSIGGQWTVPQKAPFSTSSFDSSPFFSQSNDTLYFFSTRSGGFIFRTTRTSTGWTDPVALNIPLPQNYVGGQSFSITKNKTVYFGMMINTAGDPQAMYRSADIYASKFINGQYSQPENIGSSINTEFGEGVGYVDPDERFMIFSSTKLGGLGLHDMYVSARNPDGTWNNSIPLGHPINSASEDSSPLITHDGKYLFYITEKPGDNGYTPYWVNATILDDLY